MLIGVGLLGFMVWGGLVFRVPTGSRRAPGPPHQGRSTA